jgi:hypothetical protein
VSSPAAVTPCADLFDHHCLLVTVEEQGQDEGDEKEDDVHDAKDPRSFEHGAVLVDVEMPTAAGIVSEYSKIDVDGSREVGTIGVSDATEIVDPCNECADEAQVDKSDKKGRAPSRTETDECCNSPGAGEDRDDEEDEDEGGRKLVGLVVTIDEECLLTG